MASAPIFIDINRPSELNSVYIQSAEAPCKSTPSFGSWKRSANLIVRRRPTRQIDSAVPSATRPSAYFWLMFSDCLFPQLLCSLDYFRRLALGREPAQVKPG